MIALFLLFGCCSRACLEAEAVAPGFQDVAAVGQALEQFEGSAHDALAQNETEEYETQTRKVSLLMREPRGAGQFERLTYRDLADTCVRA